MKLKTRQIIPHGRLREAQAADNATLAAITPFKDDWSIKLFKSRDAMKHFCKDGSKMHALIKEGVPSGMFINSNMQYIARPTPTQL